MSDVVPAHNPKPGVLFHQSTNSVLSGAKPRIAGTRKASNFNVRRGESKKTLVRNTELAVLPTLYRTDTPVEVKKDKAPELASAPDIGLYKTTLSAPCLNSALRIVKEMREASSARPSKTQCAKLLDEGKVLQQVNFPYEEHLYHDLVALNISNAALSESSSSRLTSKFRVREKDKEPQLSQFFSPSFSKEYRIPRDSPCRVFGPLNSNDSLSIYQRMRVWNMED